MAPEKKDKKRKAASSSAVAPVEQQPAKKSKKSESKAAKPAAKGNKPVVSKETEANGDAAIPTVKSVPAPSKEKSEHKVKARKRASDFLSDDEGEKAAGKELPASTDLPASAEDSVTPAKKKSKKSTLDSEPRKKAKLDAEPDLKEKKPKAISKSSLKETAKPAPTSDGEESADEDDDHTAALIKGFESSDDEDNSGDEGFEPGQEVPSIPDSKQVKRKLAKAKKRAAEKVEAEEPGVIYISRIPHGFYEHEMRAYFSQFGEITRLRLSRNRTTGRSKHYAFIEFASTSVARIAADTMDNYLMFGHILKCKVVQPDKVHPELFKGANRRFKRTPWNQIEKRRLEAGKTRGQWSKKIGEEEKKRQVKMQKMKAMGYEMEVPKLKGVDEVPVREKQPEIDAAGEEKAKEAGAAPVEVAAEPVAAEDKPPKEVSKKNKKEKKEKKSASKEVPAPSVLTKEADEVNEDTVAEPEKKKKSKAKSKTEPAAATATTPEKPASKEKAAAASVESLAAVKGEDPKKKAKSKTETATTPEKKTKTKKAGKDGKKSTKA